MYAALSTVEMSAKSTGGSPWSASMACALVCNTGYTASAAKSGVLDRMITTSLQPAQLRRAVHCQATLHGNDSAVCNWQLKCIHHMRIACIAGYTLSATACRAKKPTRTHRQRALHRHASPGRASWVGIQQYPMPRVAGLCPLHAHMRAILVRCPEPPPCIAMGPNHAHRPPRRALETAVR